MKIKLTDTVAAGFALPAGKSEGFLWDTAVSGFCVRLRAGGSANWYYVDRLANGKQVRERIGAVSAMKVTQARPIAAKFYAMARAGEDPTAKAEPEAETITAGEAFDLYLSRQAQRLRPGSLAEVRRHLTAHAAPLRRLPLTKIDRKAVAALIAKLGSSATVANAVRKDLIACFSWCMREGLLDANPASNTNCFSTKPREHVLADEEIRAIWQATADDSAHSAIVRLLFLLGCRRQELGGLRWDEIDSDNALITLPPERTKGGRAFIVPVPSPALEILKGRPRGESEFVFGPQGADGFNSWSRNKAALDARSGVSGWRLHDIRRVVSTRLHENLLQPPHLIEAILGHHQPGVAGVYNKATYATERRRVLAQWADYLFSIIEDREPTVVPFKAAQ